MRVSPYSQTHAQYAYVPIDFQDVVDVVEHTLDEHLGQLQRRYATASRAASKARFELDLLQNRDDVHPHVIAQVQRQKAAAETRSTQLLRAIDALEDRFVET